MLYWHTSFAVLAIVFLMSLRFLRLEVIVPLLRGGGSVSRVIKVVHLSRGTEPKLISGTLRPSFRD